MHSLSHVSKPLSKQWLQSALLHIVLLLCAVLYHLHSHGSLFVGAIGLARIDSSATSSDSESSKDFLELSLEPYAMTETQQVDAKPAAMLVEAAIGVARETASEVRAEPLIEVSKDAPVSPARSARLSTRPISRAVAAMHHVTAQPLQTARPDYAHSPKPAYPLALRDLGVSGVVWLRVWVDDTGRPQDIEVSKGSGYRLFDEAALRAVQQWRFIPAKNEQQSLASWVEFAIRFELNG